MQPDVDTFRILVTGWRDWPTSAADVIHEALWHASFKPRVAFPRLRRILVVQGGAPGADRIAGGWVPPGGPLPVEHEIHPANWSTHGKFAGPIRNAQMVALGAGVCLGFPGPNSKGTWDCLQRAVDARIPTHITVWREEFR